MSSTIKPILDACCGSRMFWFDRKNPNVTFVDVRKVDDEVIYESKDGKDIRHLTVDPDVVADFRNLPFPDESFWHIVFDPPHLINIGPRGWIGKKYGKLPKDWMPLIHDGFHECWRVLKTYGTLIFKWNEDQITVKEVLECIGVQPLYGHKSGRASKTHWMAFVKLPEANPANKPVVDSEKLVQDEFPVDGNGNCV